MSEGVRTRTETFLVASAVDTSGPARLLASFLASHLRLVLLGVLGWLLALHVLRHGGRLGRV